MSEHYEYYASIRRMVLREEDERYVELNLDASTGDDYICEWFDTEREAVDFVRREVADHVAGSLDGRGYKVHRTRSGLDTIEYCEGGVDRYLMDDGEIIDYGDDPDTEHYYEDGYYESSLPEEVRRKAMDVQAGYHGFLDYESEYYGSLADEIGG